MTVPTLPVALSLFLTLSAASLAQGGFGPAASVTNDSGDAIAAIAVDLDGDGVVDVVTGGVYSGEVRWFPGVGSGAGFGAEVVLGSAGLFLSAVEAADLDGDGDLDLIASAGAGVRWLEQVAGGFPGAFEPVASLPGTRTAVPADLDGDGDLDLALACIDAGSVAVVENLGGGQFGPATTIAQAQGGVADAAAADLDGDGDLDLVSAQYLDGRIAWHENLGQGSFAPQVILEGAATNAVAVATGDLDGDGDLDLIWGAGETIAWMENAGGAFGSSTDLDIDAGLVQRLRTGDLDGDGDDDVVAASHDHSHRAAWYESLGAGAFSAANLLDAAGSSVRSVSLGDLSGDGRDDIVVAALGGSTVNWFENQLLVDCNGNGVDDAQDLAAGAATDCDGDGVLDSCQIAAEPALDWDGDGVLDACGGGPLTCSSHANASGSAGRLEPLGSPTISEDAFSLHAWDLPAGVPAMFLVSRTTGWVDPFGAGVLCLGAPIRRLHPSAGFALQWVSGSGELSLAPPLGQLPLASPLQAGEHLHFQLWFREVDPNTGAPTSNTSDAIGVMFR